MQSCIARETSTKSKTQKQTASSRCTRAQFFQSTFFPFLHRLLALFLSSLACPLVLRFSHTITLSNRVTATTSSNASKRKVELQGIAHWLSGEQLSGPDEETSVAGAFPAPSCAAASSVPATALEQHRFSRTKISPVARNSSKTHVNLSSKRQVKKREASRQRREQHSMLWLTADIRRRAAALRFCSGNLCVP